MWRDFNKKTKKDKILNSNNRLGLAGAFIFLLFIALIVKLFSLQVLNHDQYANLALSQHQVYNQLQAPRGRIFLRETATGQESLFLAATNKDFAFIYVVPKDIPNPQDLADKFYQFFDHQRVIEEAEEEYGTSRQALLAERLATVDQEESLTEEEKNIKKATIIEEEAAAAGASDALELKQIRLEQAIKKKREEIINRYLRIVDKPGDPYEPFLDKVEDETLLALYAFLISNEEKTWQASDLFRLREKIYYQETETEVKIPGVSFQITSHRFYPEPSLASHLLGFVGMSGDTVKGRYGLEEFFEIELAGKQGYLKTERGAGNTLIINDQEYVKPEIGSDLVLTIDRSVQFFACEKLQETVDRNQAAGGSVIIVEAKTGAIMAMCSIPSFDPNNYRTVTDLSVFNNPAIFYQFEPGSVFKTITMAASLDQGKVSPNTTYEDQGSIMISGWPKPIRNSDFATHGGHGLVDMNAVLEKSLNTGAIFAMRQIGPQTFAQYLQAFGFGEKTGIELGAESSGSIQNLLGSRIKEIDAATASFGQGIAVTPLQIVMSYQALANQGILMKPYVVQEIINSDGSHQKISPKAVRQVVSEKTAHTALAMLVNVVEKGHGVRAMIPGYYVGGKTGTAQIPVAGGYSPDEFIHIFTAIAPIDDPRFVMLVKIDKPKGVRFAEATAVPLWKEIAEWLLTYYQIPKSRD